MDRLDHSEPRTQGVAWNSISPKRLLGIPYPQEVAWNSISSHSFKFNLFTGSLNHPLLRSRRWCFDDWKEPDVNWEDLPLNDSGCKYIKSHVPNILTINSISSPSTKFLKFPIINQDLVAWYNHQIQDRLHGWRKKISPTDLPEIKENLLCVCFNLFRVDVTRHHCSLT